MDKLKYFTFSSVDNNTKVFYLGGKTKDGIDSRSVYEFVDDKFGWKEVFPNLPFPVGGKDSQVFPIEKDFCLKNDEEKTKLCYIYFDERKITFISTPHPQNKTILNNVTHKIA